MTDGATNALLDVAAECGLPGLLLALLAVVPLLTRAFDAAFARGPVDPVSRAAGAALGGLFVASQTGSHTRFFEVALLTSLVAAFLLVPHLTSRENRGRAAEGWRPSRTAALLAGAGLLGAAAAVLPTADAGAPFRTKTWAGVYPARPGDPFHWAGPLAVRGIRPGETSVAFRVQNARPDGRPVTVGVDLDGRQVETLDVPGGGEIRDVVVVVPPGTRMLRMRTEPAFVPRDLLGGNDRRRLAIRVAGGGRVRRAPTALLASFGWAALACAALPVVLPTLPAYRTAVAAAAILLFALALAAPRPAFAAALVCVTGAGFSALLFGAKEPASAGPILLFGYLAGAALREVYEPHAPPFVSPVVSAWRAFAALSAVSGAATFVGFRTSYLLSRGVPPPRVINLLGLDSAQVAPAVLFALLPLVAAAGLARAAGRVAREPDGRLWLDRALLASGALAGGVGILQKIGALPILRSARWADWHRAQSTFTDPSAAGVAVVLLATPLLAGAAAGGRARRVVAAASGAALLVVLADSGSRAGLVGTITAVLVFVLWGLTRLAAGEGGGTRRRVVATIGTLAILGAFALAAAVSLPGPGGRSVLYARIEALFRTEPAPFEQTRGRVLLYEAGWELFREHPVAGLGLASFHIAFPDVAAGLLGRSAEDDRPSAVPLPRHARRVRARGRRAAVPPPPRPRAWSRARPRARHGARSRPPRRRGRRGVRDRTPRRLPVRLAPRLPGGRGVGRGPHEPPAAPRGRAHRAPPHGPRPRRPGRAPSSARSAGFSRARTTPAPRTPRSGSPPTRASSRARRSPTAGRSAGSPSRRPGGSRPRAAASTAILPIRNARPDGRPVALEVWVDDVPRGRVTLPAGAWRRLEVPTASRERSVLRLRAAETFRPLARDDRRELGIETGPAPLLRGTP